MAFLVHPQFAVVIVVLVVAYLKEIGRGGVGILEWQLSVGRAGVASNCLWVRQR